MNLAERNLAVSVWLAMAEEPARFLTILCCVLEHPVNIANAVMSNVRVIFIVIIVSNVAIVYAVNS